MRIYWLRLAPVFLGIFVLAWFVPQLYLRATRGDYLQQSAVYSSVKMTLSFLETGPSIFSSGTIKAIVISQRWLHGSATCFRAMWQNGEDSP